MSFSNNSITAGHLVIRLHQPAEQCAVKQVEKKGDGPALVLRIKDTSESLRRAEPGPQQVTLFVDLSTKEFWRTRCLREIDYNTLLTDVMPRLGIPNYVLLDSNFVSFQHSEKKTRLKELCEAVGNVKKEMVTFHTVEVKRRDPFYFDSFGPSKKDIFGRSKQKMIETTVSRNNEGLSPVNLMRKHKLPSGFSLIVLKGSEGIKIHLGLEKKRVIQLFGDDSEKTTCWMDRLFEKLEALGPTLGIGRTEFYQLSPSGLNWSIDEESFFPDPKTISVPWISSDDEE